MISFESALTKVLDQAQDYGIESVPLKAANSRILAEDISADRDFPPFDRSTRDGIAIKYGVHETAHVFKLTGTASAGSPQLELQDETACLEVMTGAIIPKNADTVIMYEHIQKEGDGFRINKLYFKGQNIHYQASDCEKGTTLLKSGVKLTSSEIGVLATVGKATVQVKKLPKVAVISTGNELVEVENEPLPHQIRKSNTYSLVALLQNEGIEASMYHFKDDSEVLKKEVQTLLETYDVLLLSGGVSKGKFDFLPETFNALGVEKSFHRVLQRPGKPFWFGSHPKWNTKVFSFPGNPVSTFTNYHLYFIPWLNKTLGVATASFTVFLKEQLENKTDLTVFIGVKLQVEDGRLHASQVSTTGSGDLLALSKADGFIQLNPGEVKESNHLVSFIPTKRII